MGKDYCSITGCHNTAGHIGKFGKPVKLHHLPSRDKSLRASWLRVISRKHFTPSRYTQICSDHFPNGEGRTWKYTVPSINLPQKSGKTQSTRSTANSSNGRFSSDMSTDSHDTLLEHDDDDTEDSDVTEPIDPLHFHTYISVSQGSIQVEDEVEEMYSSKAPSVSTTMPEAEISSEDRWTQSDEVPEISIEKLKDEDVAFYTGLTNRGVFDALFDTCVKHGVKSHVR